MLADNEMDLQRGTAAHLVGLRLNRSRGKGRHRSSMAKTAVSEALYRVADRCVQILGGLGVADDTVVAQMFKEIRAFRIYDGPSEVHRWAIARQILKG